MIAECQKTILIVEDDAGIAELEQQRLVEAGFAILLSGSAEEALKLLRHSAVDLILLDYRLPGDVDGLAFYSQVKSTGYDVPVILVTGYSNEATLIQALRMGVRDFVTKSTEYLDYLPEAVNRVLAQIHTEHQLAESEARLASIIATATDAILVANDAKQITLFNAAAEQMFRCPAVAAIGQPLARFFRAAFISLVEPAGGRIEEDADLPSDLTWPGARGLRADDTSFPIEASVSRLTVAGRVFHTIVVRDITERQRAEDTLRQERQFLKTLLDSLHSGIVACDSHGSITLFNQVGRQFFGLTEEPAAAEFWSERDVLFQTDGKTRLAKEDNPLYRALNGERVRDAEAIIRLGEGKERIVVVNGQPIVDRDGRTLGAVITAHDVTDKKKLETQLIQAQRMEAVGVLAGGVAHDFNNLLTIVLGYSDMMLANSQTNPSDREIVRQIHGAGEQATSLTRQLLAFSRKQVLTPQILDLNALLGKMEKLLRRVIEADIELFLSLDDDLGSVRADPGQMEQVVMNLVINARDAMPKGGNLTLETRNVDLDDTYSRGHLNVRAGSYVLLAVTDSGIGMAEHIRDHIFEPFFTTKEVGKGTGLGLSTVHGIVQQSGGHIDVYTEVGRGTTFKVYLPRLTRNGAAQTGPSDQAQVPQGTETILVAEDDVGIRTLIRIALRSFGYTVLEASDGMAGLQAGLEHKEKIHLLIADIVMPRMSGRELAERLLPAHPEMKVLHISGYTDDAIVRQGLLTSGMAFLHKPFTPTTLARKIREVLDGSKPAT